MDINESTESSTPFLKHDLNDSFSNVSILPSTLKRRKRFLFSFLAVLAAVFLLCLFPFAREAFGSHEIILHDPLSSLNSTLATYPQSLRGPPTSKFRDNLLEDRQYITSWPSAGWTNDVMAYGNLVYLALITERIPIIPEFTPSHIGGDARNLPFGEIFDVPRFSSLIGQPVLEWSDVKDKSSTEVEDIGCWGVWQSQQYYEDKPRISYATDPLGLDIAYTKTPSWIKGVPGNEHDKNSYFWDLARISFPDSRHEYLSSETEISRTPSPIHNLVSDPDDHLLCMDYLYYVSANPYGEYWADFSPAWRFVVRHMHWTHRLESIGKMYIRKMFDLTDDMSVPPFIAIHMRRGDFGNWCQDIPKEDCFPPITAITRRVQEVKEELAIKYPGMNIDHVVMTSDERDESWWSDVTELGWYRVDHLKTVETYGRWYPLIIDAVIQSMGMGFIGTDASTFSLMGRRRVEDWNHGATRMMKWGHAGADDH